MATIALALLSAEASALVSTSHNGRFAPALGLRRAGPLLSSTAAALELQRSAECTADAIQRKLARIRELRPTEQSPEVQQKLWESAGLLPMYKVSGSVTGEPSFTQLFSHETWSAYTGKSPFRRWLRTGVTWRHSTVLASVWPICLSLSLWSFCVASLPARFLPRTSPLPLTAMGSAIGLLLVFRVNNLYGRVAEARLLWGRAVFLCRQAAETPPRHFSDTPQTLPCRSSSQAARPCQCVMKSPPRVGPTGGPDSRDRSPLRPQPAGGASARLARSRV